jgi:acyl transferase domain-containing protein/aryl carrier-like protein
MGRSLLESSPAFRSALRACDEAVRAETGRTATEALTAPGGAPPAGVAAVQPVLWAVQTALAALWQAMGVRPDACVGHSMGEVAAAAVSGALPLPDAAAVICRRSRLMARTAGRGAMLLTELGPRDAAETVRAEGPAVCVAAENAPDATVLAGERAALERIAGRLEERGLFHRMVPVDVASHSPAMDGLRAPLLEALADLRPRVPDIPMHSSVHCAPVGDTPLDAAYWMDNLRRPVRFRESVRQLAREAESVFVEISPHPVLTAAVRATLDETGATAAVTGSTRRGQDERHALTQALGRHFAHGGAVAWERWYGGAAPHIPLPFYQWDELHLRTEPAGPAAAGAAAPAGPPRPADHTADFPFDASAAGVGAHGFAPVPPVVHLAVLHEAARTARDGREVVIADARVGDAWPEIPPGGELTLRAQVPAAHAGDGGTATVWALTGGDREPSGTPCLTASVRPAPGPPAAPDVEEALSRCRTYWSGAGFLRHAEERGYEIAPPFRAVQALWRRDGEAVALLRRPQAPRYAAWEACLLPVLAALPAGAGAPAGYRPEAFGHTRFLAELPEAFWVHVRVRETPGGARATADVVVAAPDARPLAEFRGIVLRRRQDRDGAPDLLPALASRLLPPAASRLARTVDTGRRTLATWLSGLLVPDEAHGSAVRAERHHRPPVTPLRRTPPAAHAAAAPPPAVPAASARPPADGARPGDTAVLIRSAARLLGMAPEHIDARRPLRDYGLDSLTALQLRAELRGHGIEIPPHRLVGAESPAQLAG